MADGCALPLLQVRSLCITPDGSVVTGSRDKTIKVWTAGEDGSFTETSTLVSSVEALRPLPAAGSKGALLAAAPPASHCPAPALACRLGTPTLYQPWRMRRQGCWRRAQVGPLCRAPATRP